MSANSVNLHRLRLKLFGPTLDDSILYGIDRIINCFAHGQKGSEGPLKTESFYRSCEALPVCDGTAPNPQLLAPKLSTDEMDIIIDAIVQSRRNSPKPGREVTTPASSHNVDPQLRQTRWAMARINEFDDGGKTYEIIKPLEGGLLPPVSQDTEIVFAILQNGNTLSYRSQLQLDPSAEYRRC
ncbi:uncharacterized protein LOC128712322 [Anopheles marshallii]|uniref:uncharacterized protein LOC128712322 n=1 Tax=Anopheles marshallii TaxID=1521116 RepID=UPI00237B55DB|nr:uncharacterized protein LOC128712322 [Anopheles marshallii]